MQRSLLAAVLVLHLAACSRDINNKEAVRQGVITHLATRKNLDLNLASMEVDVTSVTFRGEEADAMISFRPRDGQGGAGMQMRYSLERSGNGWKVKSKAESGSPHGSGGGMDGGATASPGLPPGHPPVNPK